MRKYEILTSFFMASRIRVFRSFRQLLMRARRLFSIIGLLLCNTEMKRQVRQWYSVVHVVRVRESRERLSLLFRKFSMDDSLERKMEREKKKKRWTRRQIRHDEYENLCEVEIKSFERSNSWNSGEQMDFVRCDRYLSFFN